jgi:hypothetical protein
MLLYLSIMTKIARIWLTVFVALSAFLSLVSPTAVAAALANVSHAYRAEGSISNGSLVSLDPKKSGYVELADSSNGVRLAGVAVNPSESLLAVNPSSITTQIATTGNVNVLVSTVNGNIAVGDQVSVSPFGGIGMKGESGLNVIGLAQTTLNSKTSGITTEHVKNKQGKLNTITVGYVSLTININTDTSNLSGDANLNGLQKLVNELTGHTVSTLRIVTSLIITAITMLALIAVIYAAIYGSIVSVGRNPLAKHAIFKTLRSVVLMTVLVAAVACVTVYLLLN